MPSRGLRRWLSDQNRAIPAGTWAGSQPGKLTRPHTVSQSAYTATATVDLGTDGTAPDVTFGAAGGGQSQVGPQGVGTTWAAAQASVSTNLGQLGSTSTCILYAGPLPLPPYQVAANLTGGGTQYPLGGVTLGVGDFIWAVWTGGTAGEVGQLKVTGTKTALIQG